MWGFLILLNFKVMLKALEKNMALKSFSISKYMSFHVLNLADHV